MVSCRTADPTPRCDSCGEPSLATPCSPCSRAAAGGGEPAVPRFVVCPACLGESAVAGDYTGPHLCPGCGARLHLTAPRRTDA